MRRRIIRLPSAERDLSEKILFIVKSNPKAGLRFLDAVDQTLQELLSMPEMGRRFLPEGHPSGEVRKWAVRDFPKFFIIYRVTHERLEVLHILHAAQDIQRHFDME